QTRIESEKTIRLIHPDEETSPLFQRAQQEPIEPDVAVEDPLESSPRDVGDPAPAQRDGVEPPHPIFQYRSFAEPPARGHVRERRRLPRLRSGAELHESFDDADPRINGLAGAANVPVDRHRA